MGTWSLTASVSLLTTALACRASWSTTLWVVALAVVLVASCLSASLSTTVRSPSSVSQSGPAHRSPQQLWSHTTLCSACTPCSSTLTSPLCTTMKPSTTSAAGTLTSSAQHTPT